MEAPFRNESSRFNSSHLKQPGSCREPSGSRHPDRNDGFPARSKDSYCEVYTLDPMVCSHRRSRLIVTDRDLCRGAFSLSMIISSSGEC
jgi:hypothetical protein